MNCFLCHLSNPNNEARVAALASGDYRWASTATLTNTPIVSMDGDDFEWNLDAFDEEGQLLEEYLSLADPKNENCAACHGEIHKGSDPLSLPTDLPWNTLTTGQIISGQKLNETGLNLLNKDGLTRSLDIHAERLLDCTSCHYSLNNPIFAQPDETLEHLTFDPRGLEIYEYLQNPLHQFARGQSAQSSIAPELKDTMRRCEGCHDATVGHDWLPYPDRHFSAVACESCHIPEVYGPALQQADWTVVTEEGQGVFYYRGIDGEVGQTESLITGFQPVLMQREDVDGGLKLAPYNLISAWYWVYGDPAMPVSTAQMQEAFLDRDGFRQEVIAVFDTDNNGAISQSELRLDSNEKYVAVTQWLMDLGLTGPRVVAELQPYSLNHNVTNGEWVTRDCQTCHTDNSVLTTPFSIAAYSPGGVVPEFLPGDNVLKQGEIFYNEDFSLSYLPQPQSGDLYILGHDSVTWVDWFGVLAFLGTLLGVVIHGGARAYFAAKATPTQAEIKSVYMYSVYERFWHWLQTLVILALIVTGFTIHKPDMFGFLSFSGMVLVHNILAVLLVINAALSLFYHLVSGEIQQFIPRPLGFFDQAVVQAKYYLQGIFRSEPHPIEKTRERKLNPLQQVVYFGILNVLLPAQVITGILIWGAQRWPNISNQLGGLDLLAPLHTLVAWTFLSFIVMHVYLTTTGHTPSAGIQAMITGWDEIETHSPQENNKEKERKEG
jgi:thiosulfate reductase cytochrome b subunit